MVTNILGSSRVKCRSTVKVESFMGAKDQGQKLGQIFFCFRTKDYCSPKYWR